MIVNDRTYFPTEKAARAYADKFEKTYRLQYPCASVFKAMDRTVWYVFTSRLPKARNSIKRKVA